MTRTIRSFGLGLIVSGALAALAPPALAATPCCSITAIDAKTGIVTARENASGKVFQFKAAEATLKGLHVGQAVEAEFKTGRVTIERDANPCCSVVSPLR
jgi:hypothetical protein